MSSHFVTKLGAMQCQLVHSGETAWVYEVLEHPTCFSGHSR